MGEKLTRRRIESWLRNPGGAEWLWCGELRGFGVQRRDSDSEAAFVAQFRVGTGRLAKRRRTVIGRFPTMTPEAARLVAADLIIAGRKGDDPVALRRGAVAAIANCAQEAVYLTAQSVAERRHVNAGDLLYRRLFAAFRHVPSAEVVKDHEIIGASTTPHKFDSFVRVRDHRALFGFVEPHANSVAAAVTKFGDVKRLDDAPGRVCVVRNKVALGTRLGLLAPVCSVVEQSVPDETFVKMVQAA